MSKRIILGVFTLSVWTLSALARPAFADDNMANCEIVVQEAVDANAEANSNAQVATFMPAGDFIFSVFGDKPNITKVDGKPIRAVMCTRRSVIPSEFDLKIIRTGIPFYLSSNFDKPDTPFMAITKSEKGYTNTYAGPDLSKDDLALLKLRLKTLNTQK